MDEDTIPLAVAGVSHHTADVAAIEAFRFADEPEFLAAAKQRFDGALLLQTCNRVEVIVEGDVADLRQFLAEQGRKDFFVHEGRGALRHLFALASGIDSMIVGEDQIIGQLKKALADGQEAGTASSFLEHCVNKAVHVGVEVRKRTLINRGAVSIGSAAVQLAEAEIGSLAGKHILVVGSGEMGLLVAQALAEKHLTAMYVANRTYGRAVILARKIGGKAVHLNELYHYITLSDVVISCTSAPHAIIHTADLKKAMKDRCWPVEGHPRPLVIVDIAQPRDVEEGAGEIDGVRLFTIDSLRTINEQTMSTRKAEAGRAHDFVEAELEIFLRHLRRRNADGVLGALHTWAETIRVRERDRAMTRLGAADPKVAEVVDDLTRVLSRKILTEATFAVRASAEEGDLEAAEALVRAITRGERIANGDNGKK
ncbi:MULTISPECIES: glutamyl-tRNA reductase [unclassified Methanoregula]|uniref:glutamyl-tRNA reductase n=1 Tax=unclassified Methanoregula TaxID=2649730 RepID=UPI0009C45682|nr:MULTISPECIES: glutamyl-tRNA reductase [unclassified Methanoregula]OPX63807.1 MAG: Glutamyl-tRNA reductase [Methanoregula sp. PtaB.Bin085]OPY36653.1 MAG: Glutamyl-tRNA reductase [Methanoregula sp. PtaU1.Bin006]